MLYTFLSVIIVLAWLLNSKITMLNTTMIESKHIIDEYKHEIEKLRFYNDFLKEKIKKDKE